MNREEQRHQNPGQNAGSPGEIRSRNAALIVILSVLAVLAFAFSVSLILMRNNEAGRGEEPDFLSRKESEKFDYVTWARSNAEYPPLESPPETQPPGTTPEAGKDSITDDKSSGQGNKPGTFTIIKTLSDSEQTKSGLINPNAGKEIIINLEPVSGIQRLTGYTGNNTKSQSTVPSSAGSALMPEKVSSSSPSVSLPSTLSHASAGPSASARAATITPVKRTITSPVREVRENAYWIQVLASRKISIAENLREKINSLGLSARIEVLNEANRQMYRVRIGAYDNKSEAEEYAKFLRRIEGLEDSYVAIAPVTRRISGIN